MLFGGLKPRTASIVVGATVYCVVHDRIVHVTTVGLHRLGNSFFTEWSPASFDGAVLGYIAGVMVGGVFLIADKLRLLLHRRRISPDPAEVAEESPASHKLIRNLALRLSLPRARRALDGPSQSSYNVVTCRLFSPG